MEIEKNLDVIDQTKQSQNKKKDKINDFAFTGIFVVLTIIVVILAYIDREKVWEVLYNAEWDKLLFAGLITIVDYFLVAMSITYSNKLFKINVNQAYQSVVNFVTVSIGNLMDFGGIAGFSLRGILLKRKGANFTDSIASSIFHSYFNFLSVLVMVPFGMLGLYLINKITPENEKVILITTALAVGGSAIAALVIFIKPIRKKVTSFLTRFIKKVFRKDVSQSIMNFNSAIETGIAGMKRDPKSFWMMCLLVELDYVLDIFILWLCFNSIGITVEIPILMIGFAVGVTATTFGFVPGGLGIQEGSMASIFAILGVDFAIGVLVSFIFRVVYYFLPSFLSLITYWLALRKVSVERA